MKIIALRITKITKTVIAMIIPITIVIRVSGLLGL